MDKNYDNQGTIEQSRWSSFALFVFLLVITLGSAILAYAKSLSPGLNVFNLKEAADILLGNQNNNVIKNGIRKIAYDSMEYAVFDICGDNIAMCTAREVTWFDKSGNEKKKVPISVIRPTIRTAGDYMLIADLNGHDLYLFRKLNLIWSKRTGGSLINADVSENGFVTAVQEIKGYKAKIEVFDPYLKEPLLLTRSIAECFVLGARILPPGDQLLINKVDASGITADTRLEFSEMFEEKPFEDLKLENVILPAIHCFSDGSVLAAGDSSVIYIDRNKKLKWHRVYDERQVYGAVACMEKYAVIATDEKKDNAASSGTCIHVVRLKDGKDAARFPVRGNVQHITASGSVIAVNTGREARFVDIKGRELGIYRAQADITGLKLFNEKEALVLTKNNFAIVNIK